MPSIFDLLKDPEPLGSKPSAIRIGPDPVLLRLFTQFHVEVLLHWEDHEAQRGYFRCPVAGCPYCKLNKVPSRRVLLPAAEVAQGTVGVLSVGLGNRPNPLKAAVREVLSLPDCLSKLLKVSRHDGRYEVEIEDVKGSLVPSEADLKAFELACEAGELDIAEIYERPDVATLQEVPPIRRQLEALGYLEPKPPIKAGFPF